jgi:hypothetical protein
MEFQITHKDESGREKTEFVTGSTTDVVARQYESMGYEILNIQPVADGTGARKENEAVVNPLAINLPPGSSGMPEMDAIMQGKDPAAIQQNARRISVNKSQWKEFEANGIKFRMNLQTQELQEYSWAVCEDDEILDDLGIVVSNGKIITFRECLKELGSLYQVKNVTKKDWLTKEEEE